MADYRRNPVPAPGRLGRVPGEIRSGEGGEVWQPPGFQDGAAGGQDGGAVRASGEQVSVREREQGGGGVVAGVGEEAVRELPDHERRGGGQVDEEDADVMPGPGGAIAPPLHLHYGPGHPPPLPVTMAR